MPRRRERQRRGSVVGREREGEREGGREGETACFLGWSSDELKREEGKEKREEERVMTMKGGREERVMTMKGGREERVVTTRGGRETGKQEKRGRNK